MARRTNRGRTRRLVDRFFGVVTGLGALVLVVVIAAVTVALVGLFAWMFIDSGAWKPIVGFLIAATVIAAISIGIRSEDDRA